MSRSGSAIEAGSENLGASHQFGAAAGHRPALRFGRGVAALRLSGLYGQRGALECGDSSPLSAGDLSPSNVVRRTILEQASVSGGFPRRSARRCLADESAKRTKRRQVAALQSAAGAFFGGFRHSLGKHPALRRFAILLSVAALMTGTFGTFAATLKVDPESSGNTDGLLTWSLGDLTAGQSAREVVLFTFGKNTDAATNLLGEARQQFASIPAAAPSAAGKPEETVWIENGLTDFALQGPGHFFWEGARQSLASSRGGQLSRFGYYLHYDDRRAGTPINGDRAPENLIVIEPLHAAGDGQMAGVMETKDGRLRLALRAVMGAGAVAALEFRVSNRSGEALRNVRLTAYANLEAAHDHENDYSTLDAGSGALLTVDSATGICVAMAGLDRPVSGHNGTWSSQEQLRGAVGVSFSEWKQIGRATCRERVSSPV